MIRFGLLLLWASAAAAQVVPGVYIVELSEPPTFVTAAKNGRRAVAPERLARVRNQQMAVRRAVEAGQSQVLDAVNRVSNALVVRVPDDQPARLRSIAGVQHVSPVLEAHLELDRVQVIHKVSEAVQIIGGSANAGAGLKIGIIDTGIDNTHPGFQDDSLPELAGFPKTLRDSDIRFTNRKIIVARRYSANLGDAADPVGHGTAVAMTAAGVPHQAPFAFVSGVAPKAYLGNYCVAAPDGSILDTATILRALDDAVGDGMDVINMSFGSEPAMRPSDDPLVRAIERASELGLIVVKAAGNSGPDPGTLSSPGAAPSAITVGASWSDRTFSSGVSLGSQAFFARPSSGPSRDEPLTAEILDVSQMDGSGLACDPLPEASLAGSIALIARGSCPFVQKIATVTNAGAVAGLVYSDADRPEPVVMEIGDATLPAMMVGYLDGLRIKRALSSEQPSSATLRFSGMVFGTNSEQIAAFSSRGPIYDGAVKPDVTALGVSIYTAVQKSISTAEIYNPSGYEVMNGTSFASPIVAGAIAVLRGARPGLTTAEYRSLIVNASTVFPGSTNTFGSAQAVGAGRLDLDAAVRGTIAANPVSVSFGAGRNTVDETRTLRLTNLGSEADSFTLTVEPRAEALAPALSMNQLTIGAGESAALSLRWNAADVPPGAHEGYIRVRQTRTDAEIHIPYWYAVTDDLPAYLAVIRPPAAGAPESTQRLFVRVTDGAGLPLPAAQLNVTVESGGGALISAESIDEYFPGVYFVRVKLGPEEGENRFRLSVGEISRTVQILSQASLP